MLCATVFGLIGAVSGSLIFGIESDRYADILTGTAAADNIGFLKYYNALSTFGAWVVSGFLFAKFRSYRLNSLWKFRPVASVQVWYLMPVLFMAAVFVSAWLLEFNQNLPIPEHIRTYFESFKTGNMLERMLYMQTPADLAVNLLVIAVLPAVFEEIFFRGTLQPMLGGIFKNHHAGIILSSLVFALIHLNITQLIPMLALSLLLGYLFHHSRSIYTNICIHFLNNAMAVTAYYNRENSGLARQVTEDTLNPGTPVFIICALAVVLILIYINKLSTPRTEHE